MLTDTQVLRNLLRDPYRNNSLLFYFVPTFSFQAGLDQVDYNKAKPPITPTMTPIQSFLPEAPVREAIGIFVLSL